MAATGQGMGSFRPPPRPPISFTVGRASTGSALSFLLSWAWQLMGCVPPPSSRSSAGTAGERHRLLRTPSYKSRPRLCPASLPWILCHRARIASPFAFVCTRTGQQCVPASPPSRSSTHGQGSNVYPPALPHALFTSEAARSLAIFEGRVGQRPPALWPLHALSALWLYSKARPMTFAALVRQGTHGLVPATSPMLHLAPMLHRPWAAQSGRARLSVPVLLHTTSPLLFQQQDRAPVFALSLFSSDKMRPELP
ncbi:hypothetical protein L7F22_013974 [Adiantum nelumboides]|nr:hypothetical protein [Adiantum nelumboides]